MVKDPVKFAHVHELQGFILTFFESFTINLPTCESPGIQFLHVFGFTVTA